MTQTVSGEARFEPKLSDSKQCNIKTTIVLHGSEVRLKQMGKISLKTEGERGLHRRREEGENNKGKTGGCQKIREKIRIPTAFV